METLKTQKESEAVLEDVPRPEILKGTTKSEDDLLSNQCIVTCPRFYPPPPPCPSKK